MGALYDSAGRDARLDSTGDIFGFVPFSMRASSESVVLDMLGTMVVVGRGKKFWWFRSPESGAVIPIDTRDSSSGSIIRVHKKPKLRTMVGFFITSEDLRVRLDTVIFR
jgi:hypothetical protein